MKNLEPPRTQYMFVTHITLSISNGEREMEISALTKYGSTIYLKEISIDLAQNPPSQLESTIAYMSMKFKDDIINFSLGSPRLIQSILIFRSDR